MTRDLLQHQINAVKGEMQEKVEKLSSDAVRLDVVVSAAEQMRCAVFQACCQIIMLMFVLSEAKYC